MRPVYESMPFDLEIYYRLSGHFIPHRHELLEVVYILYGTLEIGVDDQLYHMEKGDVALIFPGKIHHAQCFDNAKTSASMYLLASKALTGEFSQKLTLLQPQTPVIHASDIHEDMVYVLRRLYYDYGVDSKGVRSSELIFPNTQGGRKKNSETEETKRMVQQALVQLFLARALPRMQLEERTDESHTDLQYQVVSYAAAHFREPITLTSMANALYVNPYRLSRLFSSAFHTNFNRFINDMRIDCACNLLQYSDKTITEIYMDSGFESQRTFNRVFHETMRMSPREYRLQMRKEERENPKEDDTKEESISQNKKDEKE